MSDNSASKSQGRRRALLQVSAVIVSLLTVTAVPIATNLFADNVLKSSRWLSSALVWTLATTVVLAGIVYALTLRLFRYTQETPERAWKLLEEFDALERTAKSMLPENDSASPIRIRSSLMTLGIWSREDILAFDAAVRIRNSLVHGDLKDFDRVSIDVALTTVQRLHQKLREHTGRKVT